VDRDWVKQAAKDFTVELLVVDISDAARPEISLVQARQVMGDKADDDDEALAI
jgi:hypothetical protein